jgi:hypothetical protein
MPFGFLRRRRAGDSKAAADSADSDPMHRGAPRGVAFTAITEDWRLRGRMQISGRLSDALNKREAIAIADVSWGAPEAGAEVEPAPGLKSVDPYDLILVTAGEDSLPPLSDSERSALKLHKVPYHVSLEVPPFRVAGTVYMHPGSEPNRLLDRSTEMFVPVVDAIAQFNERRVNEEGEEVILVNRFYLRGVTLVDQPMGETPGHRTASSEPEDD